MRKNSIEILSERDHVLKRSGVYLGDTTPGRHERWVLDNEKISKTTVEMVPGLIKLFDEIISNSIDEALRTNFKFANNINVDIKIHGGISVKDNGRGIPVIPSEGDSSKTDAEIAFTHMRAGSNFSEDDFVSIGTNGMGSTLVNIWSTEFLADTDDGKKRMTLFSENNMDRTNVVVEKSKKQGTQVTFMPDYKRLGLDKLDDVHYNLIKKRVNDLAVCYPEIKFFFNGKLVRSKNFENYLNMINETHVLLETDKWKVAVMPSDKAEQISFVNGIDTFRGGTHVETARYTLVDALRTRINKIHKIDIKPAEINNHLLFVLIINSIKTPKFDSQTKERIATNAKEYGDMFKELEDPKFINKIAKCDDIVFPMIETIKLKQEVADRAALKKAKKSVSKIKVATHIPANETDRSKCILFLAEGDSALGHFTNTRDNDIHGGFPLRGKPKNISEMKPTEIIKNRELSNIMAILGLEIGVPAYDVTYGTVAIMADADVDGKSITGLLLNFFALWPELFDKGIIKILKSPIVIARKGKELKRFYSMKDYDSTLYKDWKIQYNKGLGSLSEEEYEYMINKPIFDTVSFTKESTDALDMAYGNDSQKRKEWLM